MKKVIIVIGQSASGKTTFVKNNFLGDNISNISPRKFIKACVCDNVLLLGHYNIGKRCEGTDTLSYAALPKLIEYILDVFNEYEILVAEGDRVSSKKFFDFIASLGLCVDLYYFYCDISSSLKRREENGSSASEKFVKTTITKSKNMLEYGKSLGFNIKEIKT